jgi:ferritin
VIKGKIQAALNQQLNRESYSSYLYLSISAHFQFVNLKGFANWMRVQAREELEHLMKFYGHLVQREGKVTLYSIEQPPSEWETPLEAFEHAYNHEQKVTDFINDLVNLSVSEPDHATNNFLQWFVTEQVEEVASISGVVHKLKLIGDNTGGLFMLDNELGQRMFTPPTASEPDGV